MLITQRLRSAVAMLAGLSAVLVIHTVPASAEETVPGPEELAASAPAARPVLPREVLETAGAYRMYMRSAAELSADFTDGDAVARSLRLGAAYEPKQLARGAVAFGSVAALQDPRFTAAVRAAASDPAARKAIASDLLADPRAALQFSGADTAARRVAAALAGEGQAVRDTGRRVKQAAYDVQRLSWSKGEVSGRVARLAEAKSLSAAPLSAPETELARLTDVGYGFSNRFDFPASDRPVVARALALAALAVMDEADAGSIEPLLSDPACASCLRMAKLNLFQCLAVAKPWYEDVFCLGQHILIDTGECIQAAALPKPALLALARREEEPTLLAGNAGGR